MNLFVGIYRRLQEACYTRPIERQAISSPPCFPDIGIYQQHVDNNMQRGLSLQRGPIVVREGEGGQCAIHGVQSPIFDSTYDSSTHSLLFGKHAHLFENPVSKDVTCSPSSSVNHHSSSPSFSVSHHCKHSDTERAKTLQLQHQLHHQQHKQFNNSGSSSVSLSDYGYGSANSRHCATNTPTYC